MKNEMLELNVVDVLGNIVRSEKSNNNIFRIERNDLAAGVYMYQIRSEGKIISQGKMVAQ